MRGVVPLVVLALFVGVAAPVVATHDTLITDDTDQLLEVSNLIDYRSFEFLLLPSALRDQMQAPLDTELPGPNTHLDPDLGLLVHRTDRMALPSFPTLHLPELGPTYADRQAGAGGVGSSTGSSLTAADGASSHEDLSAHTADGDTPEASSDESTPAGAESTTQSASTAASGSVADAWSSMSPAEKTAVAAGALAVLLLGPLAMYSRIKRDETLENDTRRNIYEIVEARPGVCIKDVADEADVSYSTASYHLDRLVRNDYLVSSEQGNKVLYYKNGGTFTPDERKLVPILKNQEAMKVFEHILEHPWCYRAEVAEALGVSHTTVNWHLKRLTDADLVEEHREGRNCHLYIGEPALDRVVAVLDKMESLGASSEIAFQAEPIPA